MILLAWLFCFLPVLELGRGPSVPPQIELRTPRETVVSDAVRVPMLAHRRMPVVEVWVNGEGPFSFAIDTGAMHPLVFDSTLMNRLGKGPMGPGEEGEVWVDSIRVGEASFLGVPATISGSLGRRARFDGILGLPLFMDVLLSLDYPASLVRIERAELPEPDGLDILPLEAHPTGLVFVELRVEGDTLSALFDTGNMAAPFYLPRSLAVRLEWASDSTIARRARTLGAEITLEEVQLAVPIHIGRFAFDRSWVVFGDRFNRVIVGGQAMSEYIVSVDQRSRRLGLRQ